MEGHLPPALNVPELGTPACSRALLSNPPLPGIAWASLGCGATAGTGVVVSRLVCAV